MGTLLRAVFAFAVAYAVYAPHSCATYFETPRMAAVKAELAAAHPDAKLQLMVEGGLKSLSAREHQRMSPPDEPADIGFSNSRRS